MAHPLFDRHDLTEQRNAAAGPQPVERPDLAVVASELAVTNELLRRLLREQRAQLPQLCVTDREPAQSQMVDFPVNGARRMIVRRTGAGGTYSLPATTPTLIVSANEARLGGVIVVSGAASVTLLLTVDLLEPGTATPLSGGVPQIFLGPNGGAWDFRLGEVLWSGNVLAYASAASSVTVAEV